MEYRVEVLSGGMRGVKPEELEALLNKAGGDEWTPCGLSHKPSSNQLWVILQRGPKDEGQRPRRESWLADWS
jgi:hypothetical protein